MTADNTAALMFDPKCLELAEYFAPELNAATQRELAQEIQDAIEAFLSDRESA